MMDRNGNGAAQPQKSRAEMFEDEKRRIIDSCFNKREPDGSCTFATFEAVTRPPLHPPLLVPMPPVCRRQHNANISVLLFQCKRRT